MDRHGMPDPRDLPLAVIATGKPTWDELLAVSPHWWSRRCDP